MLLNKKILIVDDEQMNRLVAATILKKYGAIVLEAVNGLEAIKRLAACGADLVLMDIQMPVMDGMEAVRIIRQGGANKLLPIIALTANVINGDIEKYLEVGMNGYLSKPFKEKDLLTIMSFWINKNKTVVLKGKPTFFSVPEQPYDLTGLKMVSNGNDAFIKKMVKMFVALTMPQVIEMEEKYLQGNYIAMGQIAHKIMPSVDHLGIISLKGPIREIEKKGRLEMNDAAIPLLLETIKATISEVTGLLKKEFPC